MTTAAPDPSGYTVTTIARDMRRSSARVAALLAETINDLAQDPELHPGGVPAKRWREIREAMADLAAGGNPTLSELGMALGLPPQIVMCAFARRCMRLGLIKEVRPQ
jgi:hypothetical protein